MKRPMVFLFVAGIVAVLVLTAHISTAQEPELQCDPEDMTAAISSAQGNLTQAQAAIDAGNIASALDLLETSRNELTNAFSQCNGWYFEGEGTDALGPLTLEGGVYILEYASEVPSGIMAVGMLTIDFENLDEDEFIGDSVMEMRTEAGEFSGRKSIRIDGGRYLISLDATGLGPWTIRLIKP